MKTHVRTLQLSLFICLFLLCSSSWATHISGGYIAYKWLQRNDYEITVGLFYDIGGVPVVPEQQVFIYGIEAQQIMLPLRKYMNPKPGSQVGLALYSTIYTFPEVSFFGGVRNKIAVRIDNRSGNILNMFSSINTSFYIETEIYVNSFLGINSSAAPADTMASVSGKVNKALTADLSSIDPDGDSLVYKLITPMQNAWRNVEGYRSPEFLCTDCTFTLNPQTGQLTWNKPVLQGAYAIAVMVEEWRKIPGTSQSLRMGYTIKDILLVISD
ncbi:hypothetical protein GXP67_18590 [Rhodocytophaga rosea]|uniref:DUF3108 domain-containing protein n=1 Tax=Rhodocytophaga rosea TaxID=2704465 RepID=A0A6C0GKN3_9BACT|nr:hypothetical protein [Rhodocytophaga rosea]QHT68507.1 hypothetical protein GXP67_18590 [Rhodocytophaga rosea]